MAMLSIAPFELVRLSDYKMFKAISNVHARTKLSWAKSSVFGFSVVFCWVLLCLCVLVSFFKK